MSDPICEVRLPAHHPVVAKGGDYVRAKLKRVKDTDDEKMAMGGLVRDTQTPPLEHRFHVMSLDAAGGDEGEETPKPTPKKKARTPAELIKQRREMGK